MRKRKLKQWLALGLAVAIGAGGILSHNYVYTQAQLHTPMKATGLRLQWTDIPTSNGKDFGWPRKTYFEGGTGEFKDMNGRYTFCVANHTGQPPQGTEAWVAQTLTINEYEGFSGHS
ncbi:hypothetical protein [Clostridium porci]|uniref:Uncharacterized protein n=1 Tax=Clostridium porci TaxID=2605778 RepID=A0A7X2NKH9_9CLOT|nr:hypothetical protein [Clostridium porci]MSS36468.1 hypothetical protein [Clostridium porci]